MAKWFLSCLLCLPFILIIPHAHGLSGRDLLRLQEAGIAPGTLEIILREKVVETCAFSVDEIIQLKQSGLGDEALNRIIQEASFMKGPGFVVYGEGTRTLRNLRVKDILKLKESGVSDDVIQTILKYTGRNAIDQDREKAWQMLKSMGIILDDR